MNRSALVIKMLHILYGRKLPVSREELAERLETNPRNISEFKKELETAGYEIESVRGKQGGYVLKEESIFPSLALEKKEMSAINEALTFLKTQTGFIYYSDFETAMDKVKAKLKNRSLSSETIYMNSSRKRLNEKENEMLNSMMEAKEKNLEVSFQYCSNHSEVFEARCIRPYEIIINNEGFYVLAEDVSQGKKQAFKFFKIIKERMKDTALEKKSFLRDNQFKISEHTGKNALMKDMYEVELQVKGIRARWLNEQEIENTLAKKIQNDVTYLHFMMEGKLRVKQFILSLGSSCEVLKPISLRKEIEN